MRNQEATIIIQKSMGVSGELSFIKLFSRLILHEENRGVHYVAAGAILLKKIYTASMLLHNRSLGLVCLVNARIYLKIHVFF